MWHFTYVLPTIFFKIVFFDIRWNILGLFFIGCGNTWQSFNRECDNWLIYNLLLDLCLRLCVAGDQCSSV